MDFKLLAFADDPSIATGYATIAREVLGFLQRTGRFSITQIACNSPGSRSALEEYAWTVRPQKGDSNANVNAIVEEVRKGCYDAVWFMNDPQLLLPIVSALSEIRQSVIAKHKQFPKLIYYCPIDMKLPNLELPMFYEFDQVVAFTEFGREQLTASTSRLAESISVIPASSDFLTTNALNDVDRKRLRKALFGIDDEATFLVCNVNRNIPRKYMSLTLKAFASFHKNNPNSKLYIHTDLKDSESTIDLLALAKDLTLTARKSLIYPVNFSFDEAISRHDLQLVYQSADCFLTTTLGEGWGLNHTDAMACYLPVIAPKNTVFPEHLGDGMRGCLFSCKEQTTVDSSGPRPVARIEDVVESLREAHTDFLSKLASSDPTYRSSKVEAAREFLETASWSSVGAQWETLLRKTCDTRTDKSAV